MVSNASSEYRAEQDALGTFIEDLCIAGNSYQAYTGDLYAAYQDWADKSGEYPVSKRVFGQKLRERGFLVGRGTGNRQLYLGIGLKETTQVKE